MGYQSKTWSLSDEVVAAVEKARDERGLSPNKYLSLLIALELHAATPIIDSDGQVRNPKVAYGLPESPPARELLVELDGEGE